MHITRYTDYSLRVLMYVALKGEELATIREIAESYEISKNHLMKVVQSLNSKGYLIAIRGKNGGVRLAGRPEDINVGHLVRDTEQDLALVECFNNGKGCVITPACELKRIFAEALEAFFQVLDQYTLADLLPKGKAQHMVRLLRIS
ncbi:Rrf2 family transcriptional regulator [Microbulbifer thermotolerans]|uniref:Rrf2 family transcriptional regulator n=1 Tax=Microbulbifer thermotolerans TaxID=252514 RepID=A0AB35HUI0_MICTH|nr:Rrf2 family transcriptional regulator [Microbulbifer thermotolerans]MCX2783180.1 Rrf2 family transcriptional regulator [Microbulbifer thermotolerans]MCX2800760.1 Rrf2 family transcriptional regulator [Microbulbifer thermotolerans]MCX2841448.1 Rrf2 family transcriptional regulator [Microbulbifer thermotolerans]